MTAYSDHARIGTLFVYYQSTACKEILMSKKFNEFTLAQIDKLKVDETVDFISASNIFW